MTATTDRDFGAQLAGFSLTTAEILYRLPDHPTLLQSFIWQEYDVHPRFPTAERASWISGPAISKVSCFA